MQRRYLVSGLAGFLLIVSSPFAAAQCGLASPVIRSCTIRRNVGSSLSTRGGPSGMKLLTNSSPIVVDTIFEENRGAASVQGGPGAFLVDSGSDVAFVSCTFRDNLGGDAAGCDDAGAGAGKISSSSATFVTCAFEDNAAGGGKQAAGALQLSSSDVIVRESTFLRNRGATCLSAGYQPPGGPGAIRGHSGRLRIVMIEFRSSMGDSEEAGVLANYSNTGPYLLDSLFIDNVGGSGGSGGSGDFGGSGALRFSELVNDLPQVIRGILERNTGGTGRDRGGPGAFDSTCGGVIADCTFLDNQGGDATHGDGGPGGLLCRNGSTVCVEACRLVGNTGGAAQHPSAPNPGSVHSGAGAVTSIGADPIIRNCVIANNHGGNSVDYWGGAGAIEAGDGGPIFVNCTVVGNVAGAGSTTPIPSGMLVTMGMHGEAVNSIFWNNPSSPEVNPGAPVTFSLVRGGLDGVGHIDADPLLVDSAGGDYHLRCASPCRDTATGLAPELSDVDIDGDPRLVGAHVDIGADEYDAPAAGSSYCTSSPNSTGSAALIDAGGCNSLEDGILQPRAGPVPDTFGAFSYGTNPVQVPFANGPRCVGGAVFRRTFQPVSGGALLDALDYTMP